MLYIDLINQVLFDDINFFDREGIMYMLYCFL